MAERVLVLLCIFALFRFIPCLRIWSCNWPNFKNNYILLNNNGEQSTLNIQSSPPVFFLQVRTSLKRIQRSSVHEINHAIIKHGKHGSTVLTLPSSLFWADLTIHMDIHSNPGPERIKNSQGSRLPVVYRLSCFQRN